MSDRVDIKPLRAPSATVERRADGGALVSIPYRSSWLFGAPAKAKRSFELDEIGLLVWDQCDGETPVEKVIQIVAQKYRLNLREAEVATRKFLDMLVQRKLIGVPAAREGEAPAEPKPHANTARREPRPPEIDSPMEQA